MFTAVSIYVLIELLAMVVTVPLVMAILFLVFRLVLVGIVLLITFLFPKKRRKETYYYQPQEIPMEESQETPREESFVEESYIQREAGTKG